MSTSGTHVSIAIVTGIFPPDIGGPATYVPMLANELSTKHRIHGVLTLTDSRTDISTTDYCYPITCIRRSLPKLIRIPMTIWRIARLAKGADVVLLVGLVFEGILAAKLLARKPTVVRVGGDMIWERAFAAGVASSSIEDFQRQNLPFKWRLLRALQMGYTRMADMVITPSEQLSTVVQSWKVPGSKVRVVQNAVSSKPDCGDARMNRIEQEFDIVTVCRLLPLKGLEPLVEIAARERWNLAIVGEGPLRAILEKMIQDLDCRSHVRLFGRLSQLDVKRVLRLTKVFVLNSVGEGLSNSLLEAKQSGLPVVVTAVGGNSEVVQNGIDGFLVPSGDQQALVRRINELLSNPILRARFGEAGRFDVATRFSLARMVSLTEAALLSAIDDAKVVAINA